ncbi:MAG: iron ABC transporter permease, partial [Comamonadaceae bacterium]
MTATIDSAAPERGSRGLGEPRRSHRLLSLRRRWLPSGLMIAVLAVLIMLPAALVLLSAFSVDVPRPGNMNWNLTLDNFAVLAESQTRKAFGNSLMIGVLATALACAIGGALAFLAARTDIPMHRFVYFVGLMPLFLPSYVGALAWSLLGSPTAGLLNIAQNDLGTSLPLNMYSVPGMVFVFAMYYSPYTFLLVHAAMSMMSPDLEEAARVHGATSRRMQMLISLPLAAPAFLGAALLTF